MNSVSVTGKNWILQKFDQEKIVYLKDNFFRNSNYRKISKLLILDIIKARIDETFEGDLYKKK